VRTIEGMQPNTCAALDHWRKRNWYWTQHIESLAFNDGRINEPEY
jgi:hypothetical protein